MIIGFDQEKKYFEHLIARGALVHAYVFAGPDMIGKKSFAREMFQRTGGDERTDVLTVAPRIHEGESKIYVDDVREILTFLSRKPISGPYKFVLIDAAEQLTTEASNALLKILEEPAAYAVLILISAQSNMLPSTVRSRCQEITFRAHSRESIDEVLKDRRIPSADRELLATVAAGRLGWVLNTLAADGIVDVRTAVRDFELLPKKSIAERFVYAKKLADGDAYETTVNYWLSWSHAHLLSLSPSLLRDLLRLQYLISQPQFNHRLALENFLVNIDAK